jgi:hypothetical protein
VDYALEQVESRSLSTLFHQHGVEFGKCGTQLGLIGEAVQSGNEAIEPWRQENQQLRVNSVERSGRVVGLCRQHPQKLTKLKPWRRRVIGAVDLRRPENAQEVCRGAE